MSDALGSLSKLGFISIASWNAAYSAPMAIMPFINETLTSKFTPLEDDSLVGYGGKKAGDFGCEAIGGSTTHYLNYNTIPIFLAAVMGNTAGGVLTIIDDVVDKYYVLEFDKQVSRFRFYACKANKFTISGEKDKLCKVVIDWNAKYFDPVGTAFPTLAQPTNVLVNFDDLVFRVSDQADALSAGDGLGIESFEIVLDRQYKTDDYTTHPTVPKQALEPVSGGFRASEFSIKVPRFNSIALTAFKKGYIALQADFMFTGPSTYTMKIELPEIRVSEGFDANIGGPEPLNLSAKFTAYRSSAGNPMYVGNEMRITIT
jgi:hypothetical protein